jgi:hypothetical protein
MCTGLEQVNELPGSIVILESEPITWGPSLVNRWGIPSTIEAAFSSPGRKALTESVERQLLLVAVKEMPIDGQDDGEDGSSSRKTSAKRQIALPERTEPGLTPRFVPSGGLVEIQALQRVRQFHPLYVDAEDRNEKGQMKNKVKYKRHSGEYTKVSDPGRNKARTKIKQGEVLKGNGERKMANFA